MPKLPFWEFTSTKRKVIINSLSNKYISINPNQMKTPVFILLVAFAFFQVSCISNEPKDTTYESLKTGFLNPTGSAKPKVYWWCLNGNIDTVRAKKELLAMKRNYLHNAFLHFWLRIEIFTIIQFWGWELAGKVGLMNLVQKFQSSLA